MNIASKIKTLLDANYFTCFSLYAGYAMIGNRQVRFPLGVPQFQKSNKNGRVTKAKYLYADGSMIQYTYGEISERYTITVL